MKVGNIEVQRVGQEVKLKVTGGANWWLEFSRNACNNYHAELEMNDIYQGLRNMRREMQREILRSLRGRKLPGVKRGALAKALASIESVYGL